MQSIALGARVGGIDVMDVVRADDLEPELLGQPEEPRDDFPLLGDPMVLDLDEVVLAPEDVYEAGRGLARILPAVVEEVLRHQRGEASGEPDQALGVPGKGLQVRPRLVIEPLQVGVAHELQEVLVAGDVARQEAQVEDAPALVASALFFEAGALREVELAADQGLDPLALGDRIELYGAKQVAVIGEGQGRHPELPRPVHQPVDPAAAVQKAVVRVDMEVDEVLVG
jgi:hypothetical protein